MLRCRCRKDEAEAGQQLRRERDAPKTARDDEEEEGDAPEDHLGPSKDGEALADDAVRLDHDAPGDRTLEDVQLEEDAHARLRDEVPPQVGGKVRVGRRVELAAGMVVAEVVPGEAEDDAERLKRGVEARAGDAEHHACCGGRVAVSSRASCSRAGGR